jgi:hypothetical protein
MANRNNTNKLVVPGSAEIMNQFKNEIAAELGIKDYDNIDKGALPSRVNGMIGGTMTKRMIEMAQQMMSGQSTETSNLNPQEYVQEATQELQGAQQEISANVPENLH